MKLNRPWTGPWRVVKQLSDVVYRIVYQGSDDKMRIRRRIVHHNQIKPYLEEMDIEYELESEENTELSTPEQEIQDNITIIEEETTNDEPHEDKGEEAQMDRGEPEVQPNGQALARPLRERHPPPWLRDFQC